VVSIRNYALKRLRLRNSVCSPPITLVRSAILEHVAGYKKLLVLLDLSQGSERVAVAGRDLAAYSNAAMTLMHVAEIENELVDHARQTLADLAARLDFPLTTCRVESGNTKAEILRVAKEERADLIVLGSRERHGLAILVNFTEDTVLHAAHCDVLAVRLK